MCTGECGSRLNNSAQKDHHSAARWMNLFSSSQHVANMMLRMKREFAGTQNQILPVFDTLLLLDRNVDLLTPLATQLTYEGLIDEIYGITNG